MRGIALAILLWGVVVLHASVETDIFTPRLHRALTRITQLLEGTKYPVWPNAVSHTQTDQFAIAEHCTNMANAAVSNALHAAWDFSTTPDEEADEEVYLVYTAVETCKFDREVQKEESNGKKVEESTSTWTGTTKKTTTVMTTVTYYVWVVEFSFEIFKEVGSKRVVLQSHTSSIEVSTTAKQTPVPAVRRHPEVRAKVTSWVVRHPQTFYVNRTSKSCLTPRRNDDIQGALRQHNDLRQFLMTFRGIFSGSGYVQKSERHILDFVRQLRSGYSSRIFLPVVPVLDERTVSVLSSDDSNQLLEEQHRTMQDTIEVLQKDTKAGHEDIKEVIPHAVSRVLTLMEHLIDLTEQYDDSIESVEATLRQAVTKAVSQEMSPHDFDRYMEFHLRKVFQAEYSPRPFSFAVRRQEHAPEGGISLEVNGRLVFTSSQTTLSSNLTFELNAATKVSMTGTHHVHAWLAHRFSHPSVVEHLTLRSRARQFSNYILLLGRVLPAHQFYPHHAIILQNNDDVTIPLGLHTLSTAKQFQEAISCLSPEQQRFAKAFRTMQMEGTVFGLVTVQIKPALERVLNLPPESLTKEIALTQHLMELFIDYQIPSHLLSYAGPPMAEWQEKVKAVRTHVKEMRGIIDEAKEKELREEKQRHTFGGLHDASGNEYMRYAFEGVVNEFDGYREGIVHPTPTSSPSSSRSASRSFSSTRRTQASRSSTTSGSPHPPTYAGIKTDAEQEQLQEDTEAEKPKDETHDHGGEKDTTTIGDATEYTTIPVELERRAVAVDSDANVHPTIVSLPSTENWVLRSQRSLLTSEKVEHLSVREQVAAKDKAFELLDALSRSGALVLDHTDVHIFYAATHSFDKTLLETVVQDNKNPIEAVERTALTMASVIHNVTVTDLVKPQELTRLKEYSGNLFTTS